MSAETLFRYSDVKRAKAAWLAQWQHKGCGGTPRAQAGRITCSGCNLVITWAAALDVAIPGTGAFASLEVI